MVEKSVSSHASKGGKARASSLSKSERSEIARNAVEARWEKEGKLKNPVLKATHGDPDHPLRVGALEIPCYVLEGGLRVLSGRGMQAALTLGQGHGALLDRFLAGKNLKLFIGNDLAMALESPIRFVRPGRGGVLAVGYEATILADICEVVLTARQAGKLSASELIVAEQCEILTRAFAKVGIIALVDEATGYQYERPRRDLEEYLKRYLSESLRRWVRTFPADYFKHLCRLRGVDLRPDMKLPQYFGVLTNNLVYRRIAPGLLKALKERRNERGRPSNKLHSWATLDVGVPEILFHLGTVVGLMKTHTKYELFEKQLDTVAPIYPEVPGLFDDPKDWETRSPMALPSNGNDKDETI